MKTEQLKTVYIYTCDEPGCKEESYYPHLCTGGCGKHFCFRHGNQYHHSINCLGSYDGQYCDECDKRLLEEKDPLRIGYEQISKLSQEQKDWYEEFNSRRKAIEQVVEDLARKQLEKERASE
jgi:hypothetical protein